MCVCVGREWKVIPRARTGAAIRLSAGPSDAAGPTTLARSAPPAGPEERGLLSAAAQLRRRPAAAADSTQSCAQTGDCGSGRAPPKIICAAPLSLSLSSAIAF